MPMTGPGEPEYAERQAVRMLAFSLVVAGLLTMGVAIWLGATIEPVLYVVALVGLTDFALAWAFATAKIGPLARRRKEARASGDAATIAAADPSYNPYARED